MIELKNVSRYYTYGKNQNVFYALHNINLLLQKGEFASIIGKSGSGKSTLLNIIGSLDEPSQGEVFFNKENIIQYKNRQKDLYRNQIIGFIFQSFYLEPNYTVSQNIELPLLVAKIPEKVRKERIREEIMRVGLEEKSSLAVKHLSGGEQQRVCIARALINHPQVILADEPCGNLDSKNSEIIMNLLCSLQDKTRIILLVTHNLEEAKQADRIITMKDGEIIKDEVKVENIDFQPTSFLLHQNLSH